MQIKIFTDWDSASRLWGEYCQELGLYTCFEFRKTFCQAEGCEPYFLEASFENGQKGLLALQRDKKENSFRFFGGRYMEENSIFPSSLNWQYKQQIFKQLPEACELSSMCAQFPEEEGLVFSAWKYILSLSRFKDENEYLNTLFSGKSRANFRKRLKAAAAYQPVIRLAHVHDMERMFELNQQRFGSESIFHGSARRNTFLSLFDLDMEKRIWAFEIGGNVQAVTASVIYKGEYVYLNAGVNLQDYPNLGTLVVFANLCEAFRTECKIFDAGEDDLGWKERWHLEKVALYKAPLAEEAEGRSVIQPSSETAFSPIMT